MSTTGKLETPVAASQRVIESLARSTYSIIVGVACKIQRICKELDWYGFYIVSGEMAATKRTFLVLLSLSREFRSLDLEASRSSYRQLLIVVRYLLMFLWWLHVIHGRVDSLSQGRFRG